MADQFVPITPGSGTNIDTSEVNVRGNVVERQRIVLADPVAAGNLAQVTPDGNLQVEESSLFDGQSALELLAQILLELRIANQQRYELPYLLGPSSPFSPAFSYAFGAGNTNVANGKTWDEPAAYRLDPTIFKQ